MQRSVFLLAAAALASIAADEVREINGFRIDQATVSQEFLVGGGPERDRIRSVDEPVFLSAEEADGVIAPQVPVIGLRVGMEERAYPVHLIEYHQIVNDSVGGKPVVVTYDPLSGTPLAFVRRAKGKTLAFGVSGLLYNSNFLLYDRETESLWSQFLGRAIAGPMSGQELGRLRVRQETLGQWLKRHPQSRVLSAPEPERINYRVSFYDEYILSDRINFPVHAKDARFHPKRLVVGVVVDGKARAYLDPLVRDAGSSIEDQFAGHTIRIHYDPETAVFTWDIPDAVEVTESYWLAWKAFHPDTEVWNDPGP